MGSGCKTSVHELIGRASVEWSSGSDALYMRAVEEANTTFDAHEDRVLTDLYERITNLDFRFQILDFRFPILDFRFQI